ncbi:MAG: ABC transporter ATP-binding protein [Oscillochloris sp.]|nr:ABC transporter ATP-binding protein [Oscillochloris sp.]
MINILAIIRAATMGDPKRVRPMLLWTVLEYFLRGAPYGIILAVTWVLFDALTTPDAPVNITALVGLSVSLLISLVLLHVVSKRAYLEMFGEAYGLCAEGRLSIADHLRKLSMGFFNARDPGSIGSYLITDYANIEFILTHLVPQAVGALAMPMFLLLVLATQDWRMALAAAMVIPLAIPFTFISSAFIRFFGKHHQKTKIEAASRMLEYVQGMRLIKAFNLTGTKFERLESVFRRLNALSIKLEAGGGPTVLLSSFVLHSGQTVIILLGLTYLFAGTLPLPIYIMFLILGVRVYEPLMQAFVFLAEMNYYKISVDRIEDLRKTPALTGTQPQLQPSSYEVAFEHVSFRYLNNDVLKSISLTIPEHSLVALVGPSGSGKTTMTRLIARFWDVTAGSIKLGGHDLREYDPATVLASVSMVFQDVYLFNDTVRNNIRVGKTEASEEEIIAAAQAACCHDFISKLPNGYETMVGEGGSTLSGGEKQRISIARAILKNAPIVLLDEATASLDPENELHIQEAIGGLVKNKTVIVIAHRLNTVVHADTIVVLENGQIVEEGKHHDLMRAEGLYRHMWDEQQKIREWTFVQEQEMEVV